MFSMVSLSHCPRMHRRQPILAETEHISMLHNLLSAEFRTSFVSCPCVLASRHSQVQRDTVHLFRTVLFLLLANWYKGRARCIWHSGHDRLVGARVDGVLRRVSRSRELEHPESDVCSGPASCTKARRLKNACSVAFGRIPLTTYKNGSC